MKKTVAAKAKANLRSRATTKNIDQHCSWGSRSANSIAAKNQGQSIKDPWEKEFKARALKSTSRSSNPESFAKAWWEKKDRRRREQRDRRGQKGSIPASGVNVAKPSKANKKKNNDQNRNCLGGAARDLSQIKCYNCNKKGYYANNCIKPLKN